MNSHDETIFADALALPAVERERFLAAACLGGGAQRDRIDALLRGFEKARQVLNSPCSPALATAALPAEKPGDRIGRYKLLEKIGEGGCGVVYVAEQEEPVRRRVALKVIKLGMDTKAVIARFEAERQALAMMDHPNIAKVLDAGATETGRPYFVMELIRGVPITRYCDENKLAPVARLEVFIKVCQAIQHAHQKGIIHRDIKPSNILVTVNDGAIVPKVIDFGIAKATQGRLTDATIYTAFEQFIGTPAYMSPEQAEMSSLDIDTRSDIYSLGVLLYELLTGQTPFDTRTLLQGGVDVLRKHIRETEAPRPSRRLESLGAPERSTAADRRSIVPAQLASLLRGDLDWIVMRCLEKDRTRRYDTANGLATDLQRHLRNEPVVARPPSTAYLLQKLMRRNRVAVAGILAVAGVLVLGTAVSTWQAVRATRESERATQASARATSAERDQGRLRQAAEVAAQEQSDLKTRAIAAQGAELVRGSRTDFTYGSDLLARDRVSEGLAFLAHASQADPLNYAAGSRLISALAGRAFALPVGASYTHDGSTDILGFSADGAQVVISSSDDTLSFWNVASGQRVTGAVPLGGSRQFWDMSPDGSRVAVARLDGTINIWSTASGQLLVGPLQIGNAPYHVRFSPDGRWLMAENRFDSTKLWDAVSGELKATLPVKGDVNGFTFTPDSTRLLATVFDEATWRAAALPRAPQSAPSIWRVWAVPSGEPLSVPAGEFEGTVAGGTGFSPDGKLVLAVSGLGAQLWNWANGTKVGKRLFNVLVGSPRFSPDGTKLAAHGLDATTSIWEVPSGDPLWKFSFSGRAFFSRDGRRLLSTDSTDGSVHLVDTISGRPLIEPIRSGFITTARFSPDEREIWTGSRDGVVRRWRVAASAVAPLEISVEGSIDSTFFSAQPQMLVLRLADRLEFRDPGTGRLLGSPPIPGGGIRTFLPSPDGRFAAVISLGGTPELWDLRRPEGIERHPLDPQGGASFKFSPNSARLAQGVISLGDEVNGDIRVWESSTGRLVRKFQGLDSPATQLAFDSDGGRLAIARPWGNLVVLDVATDQTLLRTNWPAGRNVLHVVFSPDGTRIASGGNASTVRVTELVSGVPTLPDLQVQGMTTSGLSFSRDGSHLLVRSQATGEIREIDIWDLTTGERRTVPVARGTFRFNPGRERLAVGDLSDGDLEIVSETTGQLLVEPIRAAGPIAGTAASPGIAFSPDGRYVVTTLAGRPTVKVWPVVETIASTGVPGWIGRLATAVAGGEMNAIGEFQPAPATPAVFAGLKAELDALPDDAPYVKWGRWFLADPGTRSISPESPLTPAEAAALAGR